MGLRSFKNLVVWQKAHALTLKVYLHSANFPKDEIYGLRSQIRSSAVSIPSNLAESCGRSTAPDRLKFLHIAMGSACELEYQLLLARDLGYLRPEDFEGLDEGVAEVKRMLASLIQKLKSPED
jgi:four helix bundle protein